MQRMLAVAAMLIIGACGGDDDTRVCFGSTDFCEDAFGRNREPEADAGRDQQAVAGEPVELDGRDSFDPDGHITSYSWTQRSGDRVTLDGADRPVASFVAPDVAAHTTLAFRLVVTDDDDASDDDQVQVTIVPAPAAALGRGVRLLKTVHRPPDGVVDGGCETCPAYLGLWLGARVQTARAGAEDNPDVLLDELRMIEQLLAGRPLQGAPAEASLRLLRLGHQHVAGFTRRRDPATAELAAREAGNAPTRSTVTAWRAALRAAYPHLGWFDGSRASRDYAVRLLLDPAAADLAPETLAAATLRLALPDD